MIKNYTEATRLFDSGFFLNEQELRRLIDIITEQFEKLVEKPQIRFKYKTKIYNGLVVESDSLEFVLKSENIGSSKILEVEIKAYTETTSDEILISFNDTFSGKNFEEKALKYSIKSENRDWALIGSSLLDDRLNKISKPYIWDKFFSKLPIIIMAFVMVFMFSYLSSIPSSLDNNATFKVIKAIEKKIQLKEQIDTLSSIVNIEKSKLYKNKASMFDSNFKYLGWLMGLAMILMISTDYLKTLFKKYFPSRIFYWGDYIERYDKMIKRRNIILGFIFITIIVSVMINLLSNFLWEKIAN